MRPDDGWTWVSGIVLSLICIPTAIPASCMVCSQLATWSGSPSRRVSLPSASHSCRQVVPSRRSTKSALQAR
ncbi:hypothetical protein FQI12_22660 [Escherichia coli]|nr:hypothetical protein [Escherichia coli]